MNKAQTLAHWRNLPEGAPLNPDSIPYKQSGSTYGADGIRVEGSPEFIDAVLGRLKPLLDCENSHTRLGLSYGVIEAREGKTSNYVGQSVCYVKVHQRGGEAQIMRSLYPGAF